MKSILPSLLFLLFGFQGFAQCQVIGEVRNIQNEKIPFALLIWKKAVLGSQSDVNGKFNLPCSDRNDDTLVVKLIGYKEVLLPRREIPTNQSFIIKLEPSQFDLETMVISANRQAIQLRDAPVLIDVINSELFETTQSVSLSEGLRFSPGLRVENNCQNCGFSSVRMNGLSGAYTQVLMNSRPVYSALSSVYGLEQIPPAMIDRVEVMRGGGSVLYGGNAIAGTINIITKDPIENAWSAGSIYALTNFNKPDYYGYVNGSRVSKTLKSGVSGFVANRDRAAWDASGDGFSEIPQLENVVVGGQFFHQPKDHSRIAISSRFIQDSRRGGSELQLLPHQSRIAEMANHRVWGSDVSYEYNHPQDRWKAATYGSFQYTDRESYYGSSLSPFPEKQYGNSTDASMALGGQFSFRWTKLRSVLMVGSEYLNNRVADVYPGFLRQINQTVSSSGNYFQWQVDPHTKWMITAGVRYDFVRIVGNYDFDGSLLKNNKQLEIPNLRFTTKFKAKSNWDLRMNLATGYRAPQAFDEDLHIDVVGGNPKFIRLAENLQAERSWSGSFTSDIDWQRPKCKWEFIQEVFVTQLIQPFVLADLQATSNGILIAEKRNGSGAQVAGLNLEVRYVSSKNHSVEFGITLQKAIYEELEVLWSNQTKIIGTERILRTPNGYGYLSGNYQLGKRSTLSYNAVYTGSMLVTHVVNGNTGEQNLKNTRDFLDIGMKYTYRWLEKKRFFLESEIGIQNLLNSYQRDFDNGISRDAAYVYGPMRPATLIFAIKMGNRRP